MAIIDIHTHMFGRAWLEMLKKHGAPDYGMKTMTDGRDYLMEKGAPAAAFEDEHFDADKYVAGMDKHGIDLAVVSLTSPNVFWGSADISAETAQAFNDEMAEAQSKHADRLRYFASLPWQHPERAVAELERAVDNGAVGVMVLANINDKHLTDDLFRPVWEDIDKRGLPVLLHPTAPFGSKEAEFGRERILMPGVGFIFDTTLALARMICAGFFDTYQSLKIIGAHGGGYLPFVSERIDVFFGEETLVKPTIKNKPSSYTDRIYYDAIVYNPGALDLVLEVSGPQNVLFGTDFPMPCDVPKLLGNIERLDKSAATAIKGGNAERLFDL